MLLDPSNAEHEAAHVVVGLAVKLRLVRASIQPSREHQAYAQFRGQGRVRRKVAFAVMYCAGPAWERRTGGDLDRAASDLELAHKLLGGLADVQTCIRLADEIIDGRKRAHARIARALCEHDLTGADIDAMVLGL